MRCGWGKQCSDNENEGGMKVSHTAFKLNRWALMSKKFSSLLREKKT
jgi:hypothetical protein